MVSIMNLKHFVLLNDCWIMQTTEYNNYIAWLLKEIFEDILNVFVKSFFEILVHLKNIHWDFVCLNSTINIDFLECNLDRFPLSYPYLSRNPALKFDFVDKYINKPWSYTFLSQNPSLNFDLVKKYVDQPWDWELLSEHPGLNFDFVEKYIDKPWSFYYLSQHLALNFDVVEKHIDKPWSFYYLSQYPSLKFEFVEKHFDKK